MIYCNQAFSATAVFFFKPRKIIVDLRLLHVMLRCATSVTAITCVIYMKDS